MQTYLFMDFESYYCSKTYTLRKMTPVEYLLDPRFACHGVSIIEGLGGGPIYVEPEYLEATFRSLKERQQRGERFVMISHNTLFDGCLARWIYGFNPDLMIDTMGMARAKLQAFTRSVSLDSVAKLLGLGVKGTTIKNVSGMTVEMIKQAGLWEEYKDYANLDNELCRSVFLKLREGFPGTEIEIMDMVLRCATEPAFELDEPLLHEHLATVVAEKDALQARCGLITKADLMSNEKFATALRSLGVEPPMKMSLTTGKQTYAFAKADQAMADLEEDPDPQVQALVAARIGVKTTLEETRTQRLINIARCQWRDGPARRMPIPLRYSGAHTHRLSGDWKLNLQNLPRGGTLRRALRAPAGHQVVVCDSSQIEARVLAWLAGQADLVEVFARKEDPYLDFAKVVYSNPHLTKEHNKVERFVGKTSVLGLGFGLGWMKFQSQIRKDSRIQLKRELILDDEEAQRIVNIYRNKNNCIVDLWRFLQTKAIPAMARGVSLSYGPVRFEKERCILPNGMELFYHDLRQEKTEDGVEWLFTYAGKTKRLYGGKLTENIVQALARIIVLESARRLRRKWRHIPLRLQVHDELGYLVPDDLVAPFRADLEQEMRIPPNWGRGIPLDCESDVGLCYGDAK